MSENALSYIKNSLLYSVRFAILGITIAPSIVPTIFPQFTSVIEIIPIMSLAVIPNTIMLIFSSKFIGNEKSKFIFIGTVAYAVSYLLLIIILAATYIFNKFAEDRVFYG